MGEGKERRLGSESRGREQEGARRPRPGTRRQQRRCATAHMHAHTRAIAIASSSRMRSILRLLARSVQFCQQFNQFRILCCELVHRSREKWNRLKRDDLLQLYLEG